MLLFIECLPLAFTGFCILSDLRMCVHIEVHTHTRIKSYSLALHLLSRQYNREKTHAK